MALLMEPGTQPVTEEEKADFEAIEAIREEAAVELKEQGNEYLKKGKKYYSDALDCYTRAIDQRTANFSNNAVLYSNRAQANLLLGNYRRAINDAEDAIKLNPAIIKAYYRGAKGALALKLWVEAARFCSEGLKLEPGNEEIKKFKVQVDLNLALEDERKKRALEIRFRSEALLSAISTRGIRIGKALYKERTGLRKAFLDGSGILHWPVLLLYGEVMVSDLIEDFPETDMFTSHLDTMFGEHAPPLQWDEKNDYKRNRIALYFQVNVGPSLSKKELFSSLMEGEVGLEGLERDENTLDANEISNISDKKDPRWVKVNEKMTLHDVIARGDHILPGVPVFFVVASGTSFALNFLSGKWSPP